MAVTRDDLRADRLRLQPQLGADVLLDRRVDIGKRSDRTADGTRRDFRARCLQPFQVARHFRVKPRKGQAHRRRFRMNAMRSPDPNRVFMFDGPTFQRLQQCLDIRDQQIGGAHQLHIEGGVQNVRRCHALVHEACCVRTDDLGQMRQERDDVMLGHRLDLVDARDVEVRIPGLPHGFGVFAGDDAQIGHRIAGMGLDLVPDAEFRLRRPDGDHFGAGITGDHGGTLDWWTGRVPLRVQRFSPQGSCHDPG